MFWLYENLYRRGVLRSSVSGGPLRPGSCSCARFDIAVERSGSDLPSLLIDGFLAQ